MLERLRKEFSGYIDRVGTYFAKTGLSPSFFTFLGLIFSIIGFGLFSAGTILTERLAGLAILASGFFDVIDGSVARIRKQVTAKGAFFDSTLDRISEFFLYYGIIVGSLANTLITVLALFVSLMVSYTRARAEPLGIKLSGIGIGERSERLLILAIFSITGLVEYGIIAVAIVALLTLLERIFYTVRRL